MTAAPPGRELIEAFAHAFYIERDVGAAFTRFVAPDYVQHNPNILNGRDAAIGALRDLFASPEVSFEILRILVDDDLAVVHVKASRDGAPPAAVADFYRISGGWIVEHWDVIQSLPSDAVNPAAMF